MRAKWTKSVKKSKKIVGLCYYLTFFHYFCSDSLMSLENLTLQTCSALSYRQDSLRRAEEGCADKGDTD